MHFLEGDIFLCKFCPLLLEWIVSYYIKCRTVFCFLSICVPLCKDELKEAVLCVYRQLLSTLPMYRLAALDLFHTNSRNVDAVHLWCEYSIFIGQWCAYLFRYFTRKGDIDLFILRKKKKKNPACAKCIF